MQCATSVVNCYLILMSICHSTYACTVSLSCVQLSLARRLSDISEGDFERSVQLQPQEPASQHVRAEARVPTLQGGRGLAAVGVPETVAVRDTRRRRVRRSARLGWDGRMRRLAGLSATHASVIVPLRRFLVFCLFRSFFTGLTLVLLSL